MSNVVPFTGKRMVAAGQLAERHMGRIARIRDVEGVLAAVMTGLQRADVVLIVGSARAIFPVPLDEPVEVGPKPQEQR